MIACRVGAALAMMALVPDVANTQLDRQYFHWSGRPPGGGDRLIDSSAVVRFSPKHNGFSRPSGRFPRVEYRCRNLTAMSHGAFHPQTGR